MDAQLDVIFVPTDELVVEAMLKMAAVTKDDILYDLGCGDGRIVVAAAMERGARAIGVDMDPRRIAEANALAQAISVEDRVTFMQEDLLTVDFSDATVVTLYLLPSLNVKLKARILSELQPGTRIIAHAFNMGRWQPYAKLAMGGGYLYKWGVPAPCKARGSGLAMKVKCTALFWIKPFKCSAAKHGLMASRWSWWKQKCWVDACA